MMKGTLADEIENCPLKKFSATIDHSIMSGVYTCAFRDSIRRKRTEETFDGQ
jgi:hypothetical protein